jgi:hypothetical protein
VDRPERVAGSGSLLKRTSPWFGGNSPVITLAIVDFPEPLSPTRATVLPLGTDIFMSCNTFRFFPYAAEAFFISSILSSEVVAFFLD